ncbi:hypothetical protein LIER_25350 [Lithospermum erythrorhizon]|uniref:Uncharacterized protein n=1 Tax=Lithospermum erythrorhizon TaxID=34254 RepID=A0AAV3R5R0_LITER
MHQLKNVTIEGYEVLRRIDPRKWTGSAFHPATNCGELVNNWTEAFNIFIIKSRDQPIITMLNTIYQTIVTRIEEEREKKLRWKGIVTPRYEVSSVQYSFVVDMEKKHCSYPHILSPDMRVLPGRPKRCRTKDATERAEEAEKQAIEKAKKKQNDGVFKASRKGAIIHCKIWSRSVLWGWRSVDRGKCNLIFCEK